MDWLVENGILPHEKAVAENYASRIADACYAYVLEVLKRTRPVVKTLSEHYKLVLVSNFYGNIQAVLKDLAWMASFSRIVESSVVGVRKPDLRFTVGSRSYGTSGWSSFGSRRFVFERCGACQK